MQAFVNNTFLMIISTSAYAHSFFKLTRFRCLNETLQKQTFRKSWQQYSWYIKNVVFAIILEKKNVFTRSFLIKLIIFNFNPKKKRNTKFEGSVIA